MPELDRPKPPRSRAGWDRHRRQHKPLGCDDNARGSARWLCPHAIDDSTGPRQKGARRCGRAASAAAPAVLVAARPPRLRLALVARPPVCPRRESFGGPARRGDTRPPARRYPDDRRTGA